MKTTSFSKKLAILSLIICYFNATHTSSLPPANADPVIALCSHAAVPYSNLRKRKPEKTITCFTSLCDALTGECSLEYIEEAIKENPQLLREPRSGDGFTPLHVIAKYSNKTNSFPVRLIAKAKLLISLNADLNALSTKNHTPLQIAKTFNHNSDMIDLLVSTTNAPSPVATAVAIDPAPHSAVDLPSYYPSHTKRHSPEQDLSLKASKKQKQARAPQTQDLHELQQAQSIHAPQQQAQAIYELQQVQAFYHPFLTYTQEPSGYEHDMTIYLSALKQNAAQFMPYAGPDSF